MMAVTGQGDMVGSVSGGCVEGAVVAEAAALAEGGGTHRTLTYGVADADAFAVGLACGGTIEILLQAVDDDLAGVLDQVQAARGQRRFVAMATDLGTGAAALADADAAPDDGTFVATFPPPLRLAVVGGVHIAQALVPMARLAGYAVSVLDPRTAFASPARFPDTDLIHDWPDEAMAAFAPDARSAIVTLTHDPKLDDPALAAALPTQAFYVGALGSTRTHAKRVERLRALGVGADAIARLDAPVGLDIGAKTPAEIAVATLAAMTRALRMPR